VLASPSVNWRRQPACPHITWLSTVQQDLRHHHLTLPEAAEPPSVDDVDIWRYAILDLHARNDDNDCKFEAECDPEEVDCSSEAERDQKRKSYRSFMQHIHLNSRLYATQALLIHMTNVRYALQLRFQFC